MLTHNASSKLALRQPFDLLICILHWQVHSTCKFVLSGTGNKKINSILIFAQQIHLQLRYNFTNQKQFPLVFVFVNCSEIAGGFVARKSYLGWIFWDESWHRWRVESRLSHLRWVYILAIFPQCSRCVLRTSSIFTLSLCPRIEIQHVLKLLRFKENQTDWFS